MDRRPKVHHCCCVDRVPHAFIALSRTIQPLTIKRTCVVQWLNQPPTLPCPPPSPGNIPPLSRWFHPSGWAGGGRALLEWRAEGGRAPLSPSPIILCVLVPQLSVSSHCTSRGTSCRPSTRCSYFPCVGECGGGSQYRLLVLKVVKGMEKGRLDWTGVGWDCRPACPSVHGIGPKSWLPNSKAEQTWTPTEVTPSWCWGARTPHPNTPPERPTRTPHPNTPPEHPTRTPHPNTPPEHPSRTPHPNTPPKHPTRTPRPNTPPEHPTRTPHPNARGSVCPVTPLGRLGDPHAEHGRGGKGLATQLHVTETCRPTTTTPRGQLRCTAQLGRTHTP